MQQRARDRIEQSKVAAVRLRCEFDAWFAERRRQDRLQQYRTQLAALQAVLSAAVSRVYAELRSIQPNGSVGEVYDSCRDHDQRLAFARRLWLYYRGKFDQRDDEQLQPVLAAADEIVWSCYATAFENVEAPTPPAPLPYIEPRFSPFAKSRFDPPQDLHPTRDALLVEFFETLPIPLIGLPPICAYRPWWLVFAAHETAHHIQHDLNDRQLIQDFAGVVSEAAEKHDPTDPSVAKWPAWSIEVFADMCSVLLVGAAARWAVAELQATVPHAMVADHPTYPPPVARLELMRPTGEHDPGFADRADHPTAALSASPIALLGATRAVREAVLASTFAGVGTLAQVTGHRSSYFGSDGAVISWRNAYLSPQGPVVERQLQSARLSIAGAVAAWARIGDMIDDPHQRDQRYAKLAERILAVVPECRVEGVRAVAPTTAGPEVADAVIARLFTADVAELA